LLNHINKINRDIKRCRNENEAGNGKNNGRIWRKYFAESNVTYIPIYMPCKNMKIYKQDYEFKS
jgi:hypothetical protein